MIRQPRCSRSTGLAGFAAALLPLLLGGASPARAGTCTVSGVDATWSGSPPCAGTATLDCGADTCSADDVFLVTGSIRVDATWGAPDAPGTGFVLVENGGSLSFDPGVHFHHHGQLDYRDGSDGTIQGAVLATIAAPEAIDYPAPDRIRLDYSAQVDPDGDGADESALPWTLCDPSGSGSTCDASTVHPEDADPGEETPATFLYVEWEKLGVAPDLQVARAGGRRPVYSPGQWLAVVSVEDTSGGGTLDTVTVQLPALGPNWGHHYFGADGGVPADGEGRCPQCVDDGLGAPGQLSHPGGRLRNAVGEPQWVLDASQPYRRAENEHGQVRWELWIDESALDVNGNPPFTDDREFEGFLACRRAPPGPPAAAEPWCARIVRTFADAHDADGSGGADGEVLVVWKDPRGALRPGDALDVFYARLSPGDALVPVNPVAFHGGRTLVFQLGEGSLLGRSAPLRGLWLQALGPANRSSARVAWTIQNFYDFEADLVLMDHQGGDQTNAFFGVDVNSERNSDHNFRNSVLQRFTYRHPDAGCFYRDERDDGRFCATAVRNQSKSLVPWTEVGFRKLRLENASTGFGNSGLDRAVWCRDDLLAQDLLVLHARTVKDRRFATQQEELVELRGSGFDCGYDRLALVGETSGAPIILRCANCADGTIKTVSSLVAFGQREATRAVEANSDAADHVQLINWLSDGAIDSNVTAIYGSHMDHFPNAANDSTVVGWRQCNSTVGLFSVGAPRGQDLIRACDLRPAGRTLEVLDLHLSNLGGDWGHLLQIDDGLGVPWLPIRWENNLVHFRAEAPHQNLLRARNGGTTTDVVLDHSALLTSLRDGSAQITFEPWYAGSLRFGPNVLTDDPVATATAAPVFQDLLHAIVGDLFAPGGNGLAETGWTRGAAVAGDPVGVSGTGGLRLAGVGSQPAPAACTPGGCDVEEAMPRWSGPVVYDWPFAWATVDPVPGFRRTAPRLEYLPPRLLARLPTECADGIDNDGDGFVDADPGCAGPDDPSESSSLLPCDDGVDNDGDGAVDSPDDPGCAGPDAPREDPACQDGLNNDPGQDVLVDFDGGQSIHGPCSGTPGTCPPGVSDPDGDGVADPDPRCSGKPWRDSENRGGGCGLGFECAPLLALLLRRRLQSRTRR